MHGIFVSNSASLYILIYYLATGMQNGNGAVASIILARRGL